MSKIHTGLVVGKDFRPPDGAQPLDWCYLTIDISDADRIAVRVGRDQVAKADVGDVVEFRRPRGANRPVRVTRLFSDPAMLPEAKRVVTDQ